MNVNGQAARIQPIVPPDAHQAKFLLRVFHVGEGDGIHDGKRWHIKQAMHQHQPEKGPERFGKGQQQNRHPADEVAEGEEFLRRKMAVAHIGC